MTTAIGWTLLLGGSFVCLLNLYLSFLRYPLHRIRGRTRESFQWVSGYPAIGSIAVLIGWGSAGLHERSAALGTAVLLIALLDTGGLHWFLGTMAWTGIRSRLRGRGG